MGAKRNFYCRHGWAYEDVCDAIGANRYDLLLSIMQRAGRIYVRSEPNMPTLMRAKIDALVGSEFKGYKIALAPVGSA